MSELLQTDVLVIGGGPGGYAAAFRAADLGLSTIMVNDEPKPGGVCLHRGCIPSKALLGLAELLFDTADAADMGLRFERPSVDLDRVRVWGGKVIERLAKGIEGLAKKRGVTLVQGRATFSDSSTVQIQVDLAPLCRTQGSLWSPAPSLRSAGPTPPALALGGPSIRYKRAIVATGSTPVGLKGMDLKSPALWTSTEALALPYLPESVLVVGGGYIGLEMATVYAALGSEVTIVEATPGLLPGVDRDLVKPLAKRMGGLAKGGVHLDTRVRGMKVEGKGLAVDFDGVSVPDRKQYHAVLVSVGRRPNSAGLGLEYTKVQLDDKGFIRVDNQQRTADPAILAIGDVAGQPMLAHKASKEGKVAAEVCAGRPAEFDAQAIPAVVFTDPEIAWAGITEEEAARKGVQVQVTKFPWSASGRATTQGRGDGMTKILVDPKTERVLGVGIVGRGAGELIAEAVLAIEMGALVRDLAETIHPHPTLSETIMEAAEAYYDEATHVAPARRREPAVR